MAQIKILKKFSFLPVIVQALALCGTILVFDYVIKPALLDKWAIDYTNFLAYSLYIITLLGIVEGYLRASAVEQHLIINEKSLSIKKSSFIPFWWYNRTVNVSYSTIKNVIISKEPVDLGKNERFFSGFRKNISAAFFKKKPNVRHENCYYLTIVQSPEYEAFSFGIFNFRADISNYNNAILSEDIAKIIGDLRQNVDLKFVFN